MTAWLSASALCLAAGLIFSWGRRGNLSRLSTVGSTSSKAVGRVSLRHGIALASCVAGLAIGVLVGGWLGVVVGIGGTAGLDVLLRRLSARSTREDTRAVQADLPFAADLLAAVLLAGAPTARAVGDVATALGGPLGTRLEQISRELSLGASPEQAWAGLADVPGAMSLVRAAIRASHSGAALAGACSRLASELRAGQSAAMEAAAQRAGVLVVLPLGCCFLPAFILLTVVPTVMGVLDDIAL